MSTTGGRRIMAKVLTDAELERVSWILDRSLPKSTAFVLLIQNGDEAAVLSPCEADVVHGMLVAVLGQVGPATEPDLKVNVRPK